MRRTVTLAAIAALAALTLSLSACGGEEEDGIDMRPGADCLTCHTGGEPGRFAAAGTVFRQGGGGAAGVTVTVTVDGAVHTAVTSRAGNFAFGFTPGQPNTIGDGSVAGTPMSGATGTTITGRCNGCHGVTTGALTVP